MFEKVLKAELCFKFVFLAIEWRPILGCPNANANSANLAITPYSSDAGSKLRTKPFTGDENQMWSMDSQNRLVNKETGLVIYANFGSPTNTYKRGHAMGIQG